METTNNETTINLLNALKDAIDSFEEKRSQAFEDETISEKLRDFGFNGDCPPAIYNECMMFKERIEDLLSELTGVDYRHREDNPEEEVELKVVEDE